MGPWPLTLAVSITAPGQEPGASKHLGSSDSALTSSLCGLSPHVPQHPWSCPAASLASARVPAACGLTPSAGSEISLHQLNCQTAQSLKLNIKAVARRLRAISPRPSKRQFWLSKQREDGFPGSGQHWHQDGAAGDSPRRCYRPSPQHGPGLCCCRAGQTLSHRWSLSWRFPSSGTERAECACENLPGTKFAQILALLGSAGWEPLRGTLGSHSAEAAAGDIAQPWGMLLLPENRHNPFPWSPGWKNTA